MDTPILPLPKKRRWRNIVAPIFLVALCAGAMVWLQFDDEMEGNFKGVFSVLAPLGTLVLMGLWVMLFSGLPLIRRVKIVGAGFGVIVAGGLFLKFCTRREGSFTGAGFPRLAWAWAPKYVAPPLEVAAKPGGRYVPFANGSADFPQFLGAERDNQVHDVKLSRDWAAHPPELLWRRQMGLAWSGFSVVGGDAITMEQRAEEESTISYDLLTGQPRWVHSNHVYLHESEGGDGPRATPTIANGRVYVMGGLGNLDCLDLLTGQAVWSQKVLDDPAKHLRYGQTSSPLIVDEMVIVTGGASKPGDSRPSLFAFDKTTGKPIWQFIGDDASYASPSLVTLAGVRQILCLHQNMIAGHDLADGHLLWQFGWAPGFWPKNSQPVAVGGDRVFCSTGYGIGSLLLQITARNGTLSAAEVWHKTTMKTEMSNVVVRDGCVFGLDDGHLLCQDLANGQKIWRGERYGHGQILQVNDVMLVQSESGDVSLMDVSRDGAKELGRFKALSVSDNNWNTPALAGHLLIVRSDKEAACWRLP